MNLKSAFLNRFTITFGLIATVVLGWNLYVAANAGGLISGLVVDQNGRAVAGSKVILARKTVASVETVAETTTDKNGQFTFSDHGQYAIVLSASHTYGAAPRQSVPLWFRNQNISLKDPLVLKP